LMALLLSTQKHKPETQSSISLRLRLSLHHIPCVRVKNAG
jgi:hypothetical protein